MDIALIASLAKAGAEINSAMECVAGGPQEKWEALRVVLMQIETLVAHEVNNTWPEPEPEPQF